MEHLTVSLHYDTQSNMGNKLRSIRAKVIELNEYLDNSQLVLDQFKADHEHEYYFSLTLIRNGGERRPLTQKMNIDTAVACVYFFNTMLREALPDVDPKPEAMDVDFKLMSRMPSEPTFYNHRAESVAPMPRAQKRRRIIEAPAETKKANLASALIRASVSKTKKSSSDLDDLLEELI